jgi:hypothetical protein
MVGDVGEVRVVGREPEDALAWTEVYRSGLSVVRCSRRRTATSLAHSRALLGDRQLDAKAQRGHRSRRQQGWLW